MRFSHLLHRLVLVLCARLDVCACVVRAKLTLWTIVRSGSGVFYSCSSSSSATHLNGHAQSLRTNMSKAFQRCSCTRFQQNNVLRSAACEIGDFWYCVTPLYMAANDN